MIDKAVPIMATITGVLVFVGTYNFALSGATIVCLLTLDIISWNKKP